MKKSFVYLFAALVLLMVGCKGGTQNGGADGDSTQVSNEGFTSPDRAFYHLKGNVKMVIQSRLFDEEMDEDMEDMYRDTIIFSPEGVMDRYGMRHLDDPKLKGCWSRDAEGRLTAFKLSSERGEELYENYIIYVGDHQFKYDEMGRISQDTYIDLQTEGTIIFTYDDKGQLVEMKDDMTGDLESHSISSFSYTKFDSHGNWTQRVVHQKSRGADLSDEDYEEELQDEEESEWTENREITYYE